MNALESAWATGRSLIASNAEPPAHLERKVMDVIRVLPPPRAENTSILKVSRIVAAIVLVLIGGILVIAAIRLHIFKP